MVKRSNRRRYCLTSAIPILGNSFCPVLCHHNGDAGISFVHCFQESRRRVFGANLTHCRTALKRNNSFIESFAATPYPEAVFFAGMPFKCFFWIPNKHFPSALMESSLSNSCKSLEKSEDGIKRMEFKMDCVNESFFLGLK